MPKGKWSYRANINIWWFALLYHVCQCRVKVLMTYFTDAGKHYFWNIDFKNIVKNKLASHFYFYFILRKTSHFYCCWLDELIHPTFASHPTIIYSDESVSSCKWYMECFTILWWNNNKIFVKKIQFQWTCATCCLIIVLYETFIIYIYSF